VGAFTLGLKSRVFGYRLRANVELFDWRYRDQQVSKLSLDSRGVQNIRTENIGQASIRGVVPLSTFRPGETPFTVGVLRPPRTVGVRLSRGF
jgi:iron complex outermembrane recepter protein